MMVDSKTTEAVELLKSRDLKKRIQALELASQLEGREALSLLLKALHDQSWTLRDHAVPKLKRMGTNAVLPMLHHLQSGVWFTRVALAQVLETAGDERAVVPLFKFITDSNKSVAEAARKALSAIIARSEPSKLGEQLSLVNSSHRQAFLEHLQRMDPPKAAATTAHLEPTPEDNGQLDEKDLPGILQQLRKAIKSSLKQGETDYDQS